MTETAIWDWPVRGAFTGACCDSQGCFRVADGGTVFLNEIGELVPPLQAKLLRVLEERVVVPVGGVDPIPVDVRIVAATNRDLHAEVEAGRFREDLYYRLHVVVLKTLPLSQRREDIGVLANHLLAGLCHERAVPLKSLAPATLAVLAAHDWPGNVRELRNVLERLLLLSDDDASPPETVQSLLDPKNGTGTIRRNGPQPTTDQRPDLHESDRAFASETTVLAERVGDPNACPPGWLTRGELEREHIQRALQQTGDNQTTAARLLGVTTRVLSRLIRKYGIPVDGSHPGRPRKARPSAG